MGRHFKQQPERQAEEQQPTRRRGSAGYQSHAYVPKDVYSNAGSGKRRRRGGILSTLFIVVGIALLAAAASMWGKAQLRYHEADKNNEELAQYVTVFDEKQDDEVSEAPEVDWASLKAINDEVCGWLQVPGTTINYPVYQADNNERYLRNSATGEYLVSGQLFVDYECTWPGMVDLNTLIYGHHLINGTMFEQIAAMDDQARFDEINTVWYVTEDHAYECEPLFMYYTQPEDQTVRKFAFTDTEEFRTYLNDRLGRAVTRREDAAQIVGGTNHVLGLITCNYYEGFGRTVLLCVPKDEAAAALGQTSE